MSTRTKPRKISIFVALARVSSLQSQGASLRQRFNVIIFTLFCRVLIERVSVDQSGRLEHSLGTARRVCARARARVCLRIVETLGWMGKNSHHMLQTNWLKVVRKHLTKRGLIQQVDSAEKLPVYHSSAITTNDV